MIMGASRDFGTTLNIATTSLYPVFVTGGADNAFSVGCWVYMTDATNCAFFGSTSSTLRGLTFGGNGLDQLIIVMDSQNSPTSRILCSADTAITSHENTWMHAIATYNGSGVDAGLTLYINGSAPAQTRSTSGTYTFLQDSGGTSIGKVRAFLWNMNGLIADFRVYNRELTAAEAAEVALGNLASPVDGLVSHFPLYDPGTGATDIRDIVGAYHSTANTTTESSNGPPLYWAA
jgi:hypothetical protein